MANDRQIVMSDEQFSKLLETLAQQNQAHQPDMKKMSIDEQVAATKAMIADRPPHEIEEIPVVSPDTKAKFTAICTKSLTFPAGRIVSVKDYTYPDGVEEHIREGGLVPEGMTIRLPSGQYDKNYKQWRWVNFFQKDLRTFVGKDVGWLKRFMLLAKAAEEPQAQL